MHDKTPYANMIRDRIKPHRLTGRIWEACEKSSKVLLETVRQGWIRDIRIAIRSVRGESGKPAIQVGGGPRFDVSSDNLRDFHNQTFIPLLFRLPPIVLGHASNE
jgi:hypothetical protein